MLFTSSIKSAKSEFSASTPVAFIITPALHPASTKRTIDRRGVSKTQGGHIIPYVI
jgi:hypothetical protein